MNNKNKQIETIDLLSDSENDNKNKPKSQCKLIKMSLLFVFLKSQKIIYKFLCYI